MSIINWTHVRYSRLAVKSPDIMSSTYRYRKLPRYFLLQHTDTPLRSTNCLASNIHFLPREPVIRSRRGLRSIVTTGYSHKRGLIADGGGANIRQRYLLLFQRPLFGLNMYFIGDKRGLLF